ncbi:ferrous iron transport protein A [Candidatus Hepatincola sp. Av]
MLLKDLKAGSKVAILDCEQNCKNPLCQKLFALGFLPNEEICIVRTSLFGNTMQIKQNKVSVCIRKVEANIEVQ